MNGIKNFFSRFTKKQLLIACCGFVIFSAVMGLLFGVPEAKEITVNDININKGETAELSISVQPEKADVKKVKCTIANKDVATINENTVTGVDEGQAEIICKSGSVEKKATVNVTLTEEQQKEKDDKLAIELEQSRNSMTDAEKIKIKNYVKDSVSKTLKSPSTAEYPGTTLDPLKDWDLTKKDNIVTVSSYVDSQNSFGATVRSSIVVQITMDDSGNGSITYAELDGEVYLGEIK